MRSLPLLMLMLAACGDERPPAPTAEQAEQLNEAEGMLDNLADDEGRNEAGTPAPE